MKMNLIMEGWRGFLTEEELPAEMDKAETEKTTSEFEKMKKAREEKAKKAEKGFDLSTDAVEAIKKALESSDQGFDETSDAFAAQQKAIEDGQSALDAVPDALKTVGDELSKFSDSSKEQAKSIEDAQKGITSLKDASSEQGSAIEDLSSGFEALSDAEKEEAKQTSQNFDKIVANMQAAAEKRQEYAAKAAEDSKAQAELQKTIEDAGEWLEKGEELKDLDPEQLNTLMQAIEDSKIDPEKGFADLQAALEGGLGDIVKNIGDSEAGAKEIGTTLDDFTKFKEEFEEYKKEQEENAEKQEKEASRAETEEDIKDQAPEEGEEEG